MPGGGKLRFFKEKVEGYKKFHQIVKTMKMVTLARYRQTLPRINFRDATLAFCGQTFQTEQDDNATPEGKILLVPITSNRGSCGPLNVNAIRYVREHPGDTEIFAVGKKGNDTLVRVEPEKFNKGVLNTMKAAQSFMYAAYLIDHIKTYEWNTMKLVYNRYISAGSQQLATYEFPLFSVWKQQAAGSQNQLSLALMELDEGTLQAYYDFTMALAVLNACCENELSEYAARIVAVENQLTNITTLWQETEYLYNKTRKENITAELLEIIGAMTAMQGNEAESALSKPNFWEESA
eukprot:TRINITY_DN96178_c0_g1_i1.p1 TRINITY_DN96178_c0_g1~~TRINITY_DN96178_c0_g1_i1.p1  ORF type:complete len:308 (-),score=42.40 TRINITY_DN96178_c0_g1_i1:116-994(-)